MFSSYADEEENVDAPKMLTGPKQVIALISHFHSAVNIISKRLMLTENHENYYR